ncbi:hypothetical protein GL218_00628 [Daldinia childiae]|uniref:uncharacterized protein n=1 Tax=Daldinia childiae TaxID=326645 RepID=UPI001446899A|nr:uncharacterized protein GL218_00628 [Daldinia childiae]KAF3070812.1 hypothetical protein GL218_00628 [Daldinia childiae]
MDKGNIGVKSWRRARLGDEPIYCAAPTPSNPDDIICLGSDEELDDAEKIARRLRYEAQALRYLQGKPVRVLSASLHGPFGKASGWKNPWLPKQPTTKKSVLKSSSRYPTKPIPPFKKYIHKVSERSGQQYSSTPDTDSSVRCHLPSPDSNRGLQLSSNTLETEKDSRIQAWAKEVSKGAILERDAFWAPEEVLREENDEPKKKRPAGKEWLKKTSKRKRLGSPQNIDIRSTPTPLLPTQPPVRSTSVPINTRYLENPGYPKLKVNQSFEFATPSSTISPSHREVKYEREIKVPMQERGIGEDKLKIVVANDEEAPEKDTSTKATLLDPSESFTRGGLWVSNSSPPGADITIKDVKLEPVEDDPSHCPYPSQTMLPGSQTNGYEVPRIGPLQQSPWAKEILEFAKPDKRDWYSTTVGETTPTNALLAITTSKERRSPSLTTDINTMPRSECPPISPTPAISDKDSLFPPPQSPVVAHELVSQFSEHRAGPPTTPPRMSLLHMRTPDLERSIKPFSLFNTPSPKRQRRNSKQYSSTNRTVGILLNATHSNSRSSQKAKRRVSFALLPDEDDVDTPPVFNTTRVTSPPPQMVVNTEDDDIDNQFQGHFEAMKLRANNRNVRLRLQPRLLPSPSQQKPTSPHIGAMAEAFREADAYSAYARESLVKNREEDIADVEQSPWRKESQGIDHVADVMENLDEFINAWDVNAELQKARQESGRESLDGEGFW